MKQFWQLTWLQIKLTFGISDVQASFHGKAKDKARGAFTVLGVLLLAAAVVGMFSWLLDMLFDVAKLSILHDTILTGLILIAMLVVLVFGIFYAISLYYAKDTEFLATLPIKRNTAFASKFTVAMIGEIGVFALIVLPGIVVYAMHVSVDALFFFKTLVVLLLGPAIPFVIANLLAAAMMRVSIISRHRDKIAIFGGFLLFIGYFVGVQYLSAGMANVTQEQIMALLSGGLLKTMTAIFPPASWASGALVYEGSTGLENMALFAAVAIGALLLCLWLAGRMYMRSAAAQGETYQKHKRVDVDALGQKQKGQTKAIFIKEWRTILRSPTYAMNSLITIIMAPLMVFVIMLVPMQQVDDAEMTFLFNMINSSQAAILVILVGGAFAYFFSALNSAGMTMYSREGESIWLPMVLPLPPQTLMNGKLLCTLSISGATCLGMTLALIFAIKLNVLTAVATGLFGFVTCLPPLLLSFYLDLRRPKLHWDSERKAMKSNTNTLLGMLIIFLFGGGLGYLAYLLIEEAGLSPEWMTGAIVLVCIVLTAALYALLRASAAKLQARMVDED